MASFATTLTKAMRSILLARTGKLTAQTELTKGNFGLGHLPKRLNPDATTTAVCGFCSTGCGLNVHLKNGEAVNLTPDTSYPVNQGMACPKGWEALKPLSSPHRATTPLLRQKDGSMKSVPWDTALHQFCDTFKEIGEKHGPESVAFLSTGQIPTEEMAFLGALAKFGMGMIHGDGNTRQCMATSVVAYKEAFGFDAPPYTYRDFEESDVIVLVGSNLCVAHPIMWQRVAQNPNSPAIVVVDPRTTETAMAGTHHYPIAPKSDLAFFYGIAHILFREGWIDQDFLEAHCEGWREFQEHVQDFPPELVAQRSGMSQTQLLELATLIGKGKRVSIWWTMGVNQSHEGVRVAQSLINLALITGNIGRPGTGANSITGQCNAMGSRLFSNTTGLLGGREFENPTHRQEVATLLSIPESKIPTTKGRAYDQIIEGIISGEIRGLWVVATNPAHSWIHQKHLQEVLDRLDFLVVQDMYNNTETVAHADLVLPAAGWGEKEGTFINSERRVGLLKKVSRAPGQALADFNIFKLIAHYWGCEDLFAKWDSPEAVFHLLRKLSRDRPCDISGITDYAMLNEQGGIQWPCPEGPPQKEKERRLFEDGRFYHPNGKARLLFESPRPLPEAPNPEYPLLLLTGRGSSSDWHTRTRTGASKLLKKLSADAIFAEINPADATARGIAPDTIVKVLSKRGTVHVKAFVTETIRPGQIFIPMHYGATNILTHASFDPYSRQPSYKASAVEVLPLAPWET